MDANVDVSIVISTYNRARDLHETLESVLGQHCPATKFEAVIVDNGSTDHTREVIESFAMQSDSRIRYLFEPRKGVSFGRNAGIEASLAPILAFADDDEILAPQWVAAIKRALDENPDVDYLTGKILPLFEAPRPAWMTPRNSSACTIPDRGDQPIYGNRGCFFPGWGSGNFAIRRAMLARSGLFATDFLRGEDLELIIRVWRAGGRGMYVPDMVVTHKVPGDRTTKAHHRRWHSREGRIRARVRYHELFDRDGRLTHIPRRTVAGVPLFLVKQLAESFGRWTIAVVRMRDEDAFYHECQLRQAFNYLWTRASLRSEKVLHATVGGGAADNRST